MNDGINPAEQDPTMQRQPVAEASEYTGLNFNAGTAVLAATVALAGFSAANAQPTEAHHLKSGEENTLLRGLNPTEAQRLCRRVGTLQPNIVPKKIARTVGNTGKAFGVKYAMDSVEGCEDKGKRSTTHYAYAREVRKGDDGKKEYGNWEKVSHSHRGSRTVKRDLVRDKFRIKQIDCDEVKKDEDLVNVQTKAGVTVRWNSFKTKKYDDYQRYTFGVRNVC